MKTNIIQCDMCDRTTGNYVEMEDERVVCESCAELLDDRAMSNNEDYEPSYA